MSTRDVLPFASARHQLCENDERLRGLAENLAALKHAGLDPDDFAQALDAYRDARDTVAALLDRGYFALGGDAAANAFKGKPRKSAGYAFQPQWPSLYMLPPEPAPAPAPAPVFGAPRGWSWSPRQSICCV